MGEVSEPLRDQIGRALYEEPGHNGDWYKLSEDRREPWRRDADRIIPIAEEHFKRSNGLLSPHESADLQAWLRHGRVGRGFTYEQEVERSKALDGIATKASSRASIAKNCANWKDGHCETCGSQWQQMEVHEGFECPNFRRRTASPLSAAHQESE